MDTKAKRSIENTADTELEDAPTVDVPTKFGGPVRVVLQGLDQVHVKTLDRPAETVLTVNRVPYRVGLHLRDYGGGFEAYRDERGSTYTSLHAWRADRVLGEDASGAARSRLFAELTAVVRRYMVAHGDALILAEQVRLRNEIRRVDAELAELGKKTAEKQAERDALSARLAGLSPEDRR